MNSIKERSIVRGKYAEVYRSMKRRWYFGELCWYTHEPNKLLMKSSPCGRLRSDGCEGLRIRGRVSVVSQ